MQLSSLLNDQKDGVFFPVSRRTPLFSSESVGGKGHNLIKLIKMGGVRVPKTYILTCQEYASQKVDFEVSPSVKKLISKYLSPKTKYSVRSSANVEDGLDSAFAGKFTTTLNVWGDVDLICSAILKCWKSLLDLLEAPKNSQMAVVIMEQIDSFTAGVLFQANPVTFSTATQVLTAAFGQGEGVVGGITAVDTYYLREATLEIKRKKIAVKEKQLVLNSDSIVEVDVPKENQSLPCLTDEEVVQVAKAGKQILSKCCQSFQDIEFCFDKHKQLYILQTRPITTLNEEMKWKAPDSGLWRLNGHLTTPMSRFFSPIWQYGQKHGGYGCTVYLGAGLKAMDSTDINGFAYYCMRQGGPTKAPKSLPPPFLLRTIIRFTDQKSIKQSERFWKEKLWRTFMEQEYPQRKIQWKKSQLEWQEKLENVHVLSNQELALLMKDAQMWGEKMYEEHAQVTMYNLSPVAWFAIRIMEITHCTAMEAFSCMDGYSPSSKGLVGEFEREMEAIYQDETLRLELMQDERLTSDSAFAIERWSKTPRESPLGIVLNTIKYRLIEGYDTANNTLYESPCLAFSAISDALSKVNLILDKASIPKGQEAFERLIQGKSLKDVEELNALHQEARLVCSLRDERALLTDLTSCGILHHFLLECGKRINPAEEGRLILFASLEEIQDLLRGQATATPAFWEEMKARKLYREIANILSAPPAIGGPVLRPTARHFPSEFMARSIQTVMFALDQIMDAPDLEADEQSEFAVQDDPQLIVGFPAGFASTTRGIARVVTAIEECTHFEKGEICVTKYPSSMINLVLNKTSGIVTDMGGLLCHAAICAREESLPCVVGCHTATMRIKTGDLLEIDGVKGLVRILPPSSPS